MPNAPALMILVAGPYRSGTNDDPTLIAKNVQAMTDTALTLFRKGHLPVLGEWFALPLLEHAGSTRVGDAIFDACRTVVRLRANLWFAAGHPRAIRLIAPGVRHPVPQASRELTPSEAGDLSAFVANYAKAIEATDLEARLLRNARERPLPGAAPACTARHRCANPDRKRPMSARAVGRCTGL